MDLILYKSSQGAGPDQTDLQFRILPVPVLAAQCVLKMPEIQVGGKRPVTILNIDGIRVRWGIHVLHEGHAMVVHGVFPVWQHGVAQRGRSEHGYDIIDTDTVGVIIICIVKDIIVKVYPDIAVCAYIAYGIKSFFSLLTFIYFRQFLTEGDAACRSYRYAVYGISFDNDNDFFLLLLRLFRGFHNYGRRYIFQPD